MSKKGTIWSSWGDDIDTDFSVSFDDPLDRERFLPRDYEYDGRASGQLSAWRLDDADLFEWPDGKRHRRRNARMAREDQD